ncbi:MAG: ABC transporter substrate-binding protein [Candidatus Binatia bacterium]
MRLSVLAIALVVSLSPFAVEAQPAAAQQPTKIARLGYLTSDSVSIDLARRNAFKQGLRDLGYIEGQNIVIEYRGAGGDSKTLPELMAELLRLKVDVVFAFTTPSIRAAKNATKEVPIVFAAHAPVELGVVASLARPGGNMTGLSLSAGPGIYGKYLELLKELVPKLSRVAALSNPVNPLTAVQLKETQSAAVALGVTLLSFDVKGPDDLEAVFAAIKKERAEALIVLLDAMLLGQGRRIADLSVKSGLPSIYGVPEHAEAGGLMAYAADRLDIFRRAATYVDKILKGAKPADLPVEQPTKFDLVINLKTAKALGLTIPPSLLLRAERVID